MVLEIHDSYDFGITLNCAIRTFVRSMDRDAFNAINILMRGLTDHIDNRTLVAAIRDFQPDSADFCTFTPMPDDLRDDFENLREYMMMTYIKRKINPDNIYGTQYDMAMTGRDMECIGSPFFDSSDKMFQDQDDFLVWAYERYDFIPLKSPAGYEDITVEDKGFTEAINAICPLAVKYAYGRLTGIIDQVFGFMICNKDILSRRTVDAVSEIVGKNMPNRLL